MLRQTLEFASEVKESYEEFAFHKIYHRLNHFCIVDLSAFYFDVLKDRLYISAPKSLARRSAQTAIWRIGEALVRLLAPIMSFTSEEVWDYLPKIDGRETERASGIISVGGRNPGREFGEGRTETTMTGQRCARCATKCSRRWKRRATIS